MDEPSAPVRMRSRGRQSMRRPRTRMTHYVGNQGLVSPLRDPALMLRRRTLVNGLFTYVEEIRIWIPAMLFGFADHMIRMIWKH